ncbi:Nucleotide-binding universal stress protein, UspA family [Aquimarina amphilecti]|uniref:Nucleotide-binding universal stress protein, UspA family n=1 Tax=Aquimarina amphilecti TaxID=1038014 RepID=A0A1H7MEN8_AQUAM|nr:universal stress protein [Aquimarina amphilecti]SEL09644.1 Nucleotide-binding universal stress protein, UspA family [Aquimarina amphilecti]
MRKILIPTDFSENAMNAIQYATELFKYEKSEFLIFHAYADEVYDNNELISRKTLKKLKEQTHKNSDTELEKILSTLNTISPNPRHEYKISSIFGTLVDEANDLVDRENIDILIMGTKGKTDDRNITFGSNTLQVLKYVKSPVLVIPENCKYQQPKNILFPTDYMLPYKRRELKLLSTLTKSFRSSINFLHVSKYEKLSIRQEDNKVFIQECLPDAEIFFHTANEKDITKVTNQFIEKNEINMLVMVNSRHSYLECVLHQSTIDQIGLHIKIPFLTMQNLQRN